MRNRVLASVFAALMLGLGVGVGRLSSPAGSDAPDATPSDAIAVKEEAASKQPVAARLPSPQVAVSYDWLSDIAAFERKSEAPASAATPKREARVNARTEARVEESNWKVGILGPMMNTQDASDGPSASGGDDDEGASRPSDLLDFANYRAAGDCFLYWVDTVTTTDDEFIDLVTAEYESRDVDSPYDFDAMDADARQKLIYSLRLERLDGSFDFDRWFELEGKERTPAQKRQLREDKYRTWLSMEARQQFRKRFTKSNTSTLRSAGAPDFNAGEAAIYIRIRDLVANEDVLYRVDLSLYPEGLGWRWYLSEPVSEDVLDDAGSETNGPAAKDEIDEIQDRIAQANEEIDEVNRQIEALQQERAVLMDRRQDLVARRIELERELDPYGTPERTLRTALGALREGKWETFLSCHSKDIREENEKSAAAKAHFVAAAGGDGKRSKVRDLGRIREKIVDRDNENIIYLTVDITVSHRKKRSFNETLEESERGTEPARRTGIESEVEAVSETKRIRLRFVQEGSKWLIDEEIA